MCRVRRGAQGTDAASSHRRVSGEGTFWFLFGPSKWDSHALRANALHLLRFASFTTATRFQGVREEQSFRAVRAAYFCLVKSKQDSADALATGEAGPKGERRRRESNRHRRRLADAMKPHRSPALLA